MDFNLREGQKEIVDYQGGMMAVPAVPGAGKTYTLACLASKLIKEERVKEGKILIVTYMNSAVANFRERIDEFLAKRGVKNSSGYQVKTLHSLAMNILKERPDYLLINEEFQVLEEGKQKSIINDLATEWLEDNKQRWEFLLASHQGSYYQNALEKWSSDFPKLAQSSIAYLKGRGISLKQAKQLLNRSTLSDDSYLSFFLEIFIDYNLYLANNGLLDFNDLIYNAWRLLKTDAKLRERLSQKWQYIFEDEAQDSNPIQEQILKLLAENNNNLLRVGDSNQAIMGTFTLADPDNFRSFCRDEQVEKGAILRSSRSTKEIIDLANHLVRWVRKQHPVPECKEALEGQFIKPVSTDDPLPNPVVKDYGIKTKRLASQVEEMAWVSKQAANYIEQYPKDTVAILVPDRFYKADIIKLLKEADIEYAEIKGINRQQESTIDLIETLLIYLAKPDNKDKLKELLVKHLLNYEQMQAELIEEVLKKLNPYELLYPLADELDIFSLPEELYQDSQLFSLFKDSLKDLRKFLKAAVRLPADELVLFLAEEFSFKKDLLALAQGIALYIKDLLRENPNWELSDVVKNLEEIKPSFYSLAQKISETEGVQIEAGVVNILTKHKSKGLEWDNVFITAQVKRNYQTYLSDKYRGENWYLPKDLSNPTALVKAETDALLAGRVLKNSEAKRKAKTDYINERIRLLYVAITRAKKRLCLTTYLKNEFKGKVYDSYPSKLFEVLEEKIKKEQKDYESK